MDWHQTTCGPNRVPICETRHISGPSGRGGRRPGVCSPDVVTNLQRRAEWSFARWRARTRTYSTFAMWRGMRVVYSAVGGTRHWNVSCLVSTPAAFRPIVTLSSQYCFDGFSQNLTPSSSANCRAPSPSPHPYPVADIVYVSGPTSSGCEVVRQPHDNSASRPHARRIPECFEASTL